MKRALATLPCLLTLAACGGEDASDAGDRHFAQLELEATYPHAFSYLGGVRELSDGKILVADPTSQVLLRLDLEAGTADTLGREGPGPQEYLGPDRVFPLPGDSSLLVDLGNGRLTVIDPEGTFVDWTPMSTPTEDGWPRTIHPSFVDDAGNLYAGGPYSREGPPDTTALHRIVRTTREETRVAAAWHAPFVMPQPGDKRPMMIMYDDWAVAGDGRVAVIRANGYSVDWYLPDGTVVNGPPNEVETYPVGMPEKEAALEHFAANAVSSYSEVSDEGVQSMRMSRGASPGSLSGVDEYAWPETLPVFSSDGALVSPEGHLWVHRMMPAGGPGRAEVFDDQGMRVGFIELPPQSKVIDFGVTGDPGSTVYLARTDDVGLVWLERHRVIGAGERH